MHDRRLQTNVRLTTTTHLYNDGAVGPEVAVPEVRWVEREVKGQHHAGGVACLFQLGEGREVNIRSGVPNQSGVTPWRVEEDWPRGREALLETARENTFYSLSFRDCFLF